MSTQTEKSKDNPLVKLVKKSVGLPTNDCCSVSTQEQKAESCCGEQLSATSNEQPTSTAATSGCGCGETQSSCCSEQEQDVQPEN